MVWVGRAGSLCVMQRRINVFGNLFTNSRYFNQIVYCGAFNFLPAAKMFKQLLASFRPYALDTFQWRAIAFVRAARCGR